MNEILQEELSIVNKMLPSLQKQRASSPFANDVYEAVAYWRDLGQRAFNGDSRIDYSKRAREEMSVLDRLAKLLRSRPVEDQRRYADVFEVAKGLLSHVEKTATSDEGYLGTVAIIKARFHFYKMIMASISTLSNLRVSAILRVNFTSIFAILRRPAYHVRLVLNRQMLPFSGLTTSYSYVRCLARARMTATG